MARPVDADAGAAVVCVTFICHKVVLRFKEMFPFRIIQADVELSRRTWIARFSYAAVRGEEGTTSAITPSRLSSIFMQEIITDEVRREFVQRPRWRAPCHPGA